MSHSLDLKQKFNRITNYYIPTILCSDSDDIIITSTKTHFNHTSNHVFPSKPSSKPSLKLIKQKNKQTIYKKNTILQSFILQPFESIQLLEASLLNLLKPTPKTTTLDIYSKHNFHTRNFITNYSIDDFIISPNPKLTLWELAAHIDTSINSQHSSTPTIEKNITKIKQKYDQRISDAAIKLKQKISDLEENHRIWVEKEKQDCQRLIDDMMNNPFQQFGNPKDKDTEINATPEKSKTSLRNSTSPKIRKTPNHNMPTACIFDLTSSSGLSSDDDEWLVS